MFLIFSGMFCAVPQENAEIPAEIPTKIKFDRKVSPYFSSIDKDILSDVQNGSPQSLKNAVSKLRKATISYSENEKVLLNIVSQIMSVVWKSERPLEDIPKVSEEYYLGMIALAKIGVFENAIQGSGAESQNADFFSLVLPCLAVVSDSVRRADFDEIFLSLDAALKLKSDSVLCNYLLGVLFKKQGKYEDAAACFDRATEKNSIVYEILFEKAACLIQLKKYDEVSNILDRMIVQYPSDTAVFKLYANAAFLMGDFSKAEQYASLVLQQNTEDWEFVLFRAKVFVATGDYMRASGLLDAYSRHYPDGREYLLLRSKLQRERNKNVGLAVSTIERALELYPDDPAVVLYAADLASYSNRKIKGKTAGELADMVLKNDAQNPDALLIRARSLFSAGQVSEAYESSKKIMALKPIPKDAVPAHIQICLALKYNDEAWRYASSLYSSDTEDPDNVRVYIDVMIKTGRTGNATRMINSLLNSSPSAEMKSFLFYERSFLQSSDTASLSDLRSSLIANPRNSDALFRMYEIYFERRDYRKAQYYLRQVLSLNPGEEKYIRLNTEIERLVK